MDRVVLVTGSSLGIGRETALLFAKGGSSVVVTYHENEKEAEAVALACGRDGAPEVLVARLDVTDPNSIAECLARVLDRFGRIDILVNNAGTVVWNELAHQTASDIEAQIRVNLEGLIKVTKACLPHVKGAIVNVASLAAHQGMPTLTTYCATKFGVRGFTEALAHELPGIGVFSVSPGMTATRLSGYRGVPPGDVAQIIVNTADGKYETPSGADVNVLDHLEEKET